MGRHRPLSFAGLTTAAAVVVAACQPSAAIKPVTYVPIESAQAAASPPPPPASKNRAATEASSSSSSGGSAPAGRDGADDTIAALSGSDAATKPAAHKGAGHDDTCHKATKGCCSDTTVRGVRRQGKLQCPRGSIPTASCRGFGGRC